MTQLGQSARQKEAHARDAGSSGEAVDLRIAAAHDREAAETLGGLMVSCLWTKAAPFGNVCRTECGSRFAYSIMFRHCPSCGRGIEVVHYRAE